MSESRDEAYERRHGDIMARIDDPQYLKRAGFYPIVTDPPSKLISDYPDQLERLKGKVKIDEPPTIADFVEDNGGGADG